MSYPSQKSIELVFLLDQGEVEEKQFRPISDDLDENEELATPDEENKLTNL